MQSGQPQPVYLLVWLAECCKDTSAEPTLVAGGGDPLGKVRRAVDARQTVVDWIGETGLQDQIGERTGAVLADAEGRPPQPLVKRARELLGTAIHPLSAHRASP